MNPPDTGDLLQLLNTAPGPLTLNLGFTGTQRVWTGPQAKAVNQWLEEQSAVDVLRHGLCAGSDLLFHRAVRALYGSMTYIIGYPGPGPLPVEWDTRFKLIDVNPAVCHFRAERGGRGDLLEIIDRMWIEFEPLQYDESVYIDE